MSYFDQVNGFMDNIESTQNAINGVKSQQMSTAIGDLQDKYSLIKQKALEGVPDIAGDVLNYATQGVTALSGTYSTVRALKNSSIAKKIARASGEPSDAEKAGGPEPDVDKFGLPKLSPEESADFSSRLNKLRTKTDLDDSAETVTQESNPKAAYEDLVRDRAQGNLEPNSAYRELQNDRAAQGAGAEPAPQPLPPRPEEPLVAREVDPVTDRDIGAPEPEPAPKPPTDEELGLDPVTGFSPEEQKAIETSNDPEKLAESLRLQRESAVKPVPEPEAKPVPFESLFPAPAQPATLSQKAAALAQTSQEGGSQGGSSLLARVTQGAEDNKPIQNPEAAGASAAEEVSVGSKLATAADVAEAPLAIAGMVAGDIKGKGAATTSQVINDTVGAKQAYNLGRRGRNYFQDKGEADADSEVPQKTGELDQLQKPVDYEPLEEPPLDVDARIAQIRQRAQQAQDALPTEDDPSLTPKLQALEEQQKPAAPVQQAADPASEAAAPEPPSDPSTIQMTKPEFETSDAPVPPEPDLPDVIAKPTSAVKDAISNVTDDVEGAGKSLGERILGTLGADSASEAALDVLGPVGEVVGLGLTLGGIFHDIFGKKKQEEQQQAAEDKAQNQEDQAEANLKTQQATIGTTTGALDLGSLHNIAGANAAVGIV